MLLYENGSRAAGGGPTHLGPRSASAAAAPEFTRRASPERVGASTLAKGRKPAKGGPRGTREEDSDDSGSEEDKRPAERRVGKQSSTAGMMPPSDSESGSDEEDEPSAPPAKSKAAGGGQPATAGMLPPSDSDDEDDEDDDEDDDDDEEGAAPARCATQTSHEWAPVWQRLASACAAVRRLARMRWLQLCEQSLRRSVRWRRSEAQRFGSASGTSVRLRLWRSRRRRWPLSWQSLSSCASAGAHAVRRRAAAALSLNALLRRRARAGLIRLLSASPLKASIASRLSERRALCLRLRVKCEHSAARRCPAHAPPAAHRPNSGSRQYSA